MEKITNFLKTYWWIWLILLVISSLFIILGASAIISFLSNVFLGIIVLLLGTIVLLSILAIFWLYSFGKGQTKSWGVFRILGIFGVLFFVFALYIVLDGKKNLVEAQNDSRFNFVSLGLFFSLLLFILGEIFLYLENLQNSIKNIEANNVKKNTSNNMTCPRCYGKGFVDLNDIKRLGMEQEWGQGFCRYCEGEGEVEKGKTKILNPLRTNIGPAWHESDIL